MIDQLQDYKNYVIVSYFINTIFLAILLITTLVKYKKIKKLAKDVKKN